MSATKRSVSRTMNASPLGNQATTDESSLCSMSMSLRGKGLDPELPGEAMGDCTGDGATPPPALPEDRVRVMRRLVRWELSKEASLARLVDKVVEVLDGEVPAPKPDAVGLSLITPAAPMLAPNGNTKVLTLAETAGESSGLGSGVLWGAITVSGCGSGTEGGGVGGGGRVGGGGGGWLKERACAAARNPAKYMARNCACFSSSSLLAEDEIDGLAAPPVECG